MRTENKPVAWNCMKLKRVVSRSKIRSKNLKGCRWNQSIQKERKPATRFYEVSSYTATLLARLHTVFDFQSNRNAPSDS